MEPALSPAAVCQVMNLAGSEQDQILFCQYKLLYFLVIYSYVLGVVCQWLPVCAGKHWAVRVVRACTHVKVKNGVEQVKTGKCSGLELHLGLFLVIKLTSKPCRAL